MNQEENVLRAKAGSRRFGCTPSRDRSQRAGGEAIAQFDSGARRHPMRFSRATLANRRARSGGRRLR